MSKLTFEKLEGYKYRVKEVQDHTLPGFDLGLEYQHEYFFLRKSKLAIKKGYAWDGASGPTWDDKTNYRGSLVHDVLYQVLRESPLTDSTRSMFRAMADKYLIELCLEDGMSKLRAKLWYFFIRRFGKKASLPGNDHRGKVIRV